MITLIKVVKMFYFPRHLQKKAIKRNLPMQRAAPVKTTSSYLPGPNCGYTIDIIGTKIN